MVDDDLEYKTKVGDFKPGSIKVIELRNFLTHGHVVIKPGPRLNIVVGANGTGKSTILNAICLGLGGDPKLLGRADDLREFIMHDKDMAEITIELVPRPGKDTDVIRRVIDRNKGSERGRGRGASTFYINGAQSNLAAVRELVIETYSISIDNLCTFLPQDKVGDFSGFTDQQRLEATEKTLSGNQHLYKTHQELIALEQEMDSSVGNVETIKDKLKKLKHENERLEREKERMEERERALEQANLLKKKLVWMRFEAERTRLVEMKEEKTRIKAQVIAAMAELKPLEDECQRISSRKKELETACKAHETTSGRHWKDMDSQTKKYENHDDDIEGCIAQLQAIDTKRAQLENEYEEAAKRLEKLEEQESSLPPDEQIEKEHMEALEQVKFARRAYQDAKEEERKQNERFKEIQERTEHCQRKLASMNDDSARRKDRFFRSNPNLLKVQHWIDQNRMNFRRPVLGPIACELSPKSESIAASLEFHVPNNILRSYVVETKEDYDRLYRGVRDELNLPINVIECASIKKISRPFSEQKLSVLKKDHGVVGYLDELVSAPDTIHQVLRDFASLHKVLIGGDATHSSINKGLLSYLSEPDVNLNQQGLQPSCIFASDGGRFSRYTQSISRYSKSMSSRVDDVLPARMLAPGVSPHLKKEAEESLAAAHQELNELRPVLSQVQNDMKKFELEMQSTNQKLSAAKQAKDNLASFKSKLERQRLKVNDKKGKLYANDDVEKRDLVKELMNRVKHSVSALEAHADMQSKLLQSAQASAGSQFALAEASAAERGARLAYEEKKASTDQLDKAARKLQEDYAKCRARAENLRKEATIVAPIVDAQGEPLPLKARLDALPVDTMQEIEAALEDAEQIANSIGANPDVIRHYEQRKREIEETQRTLDDLSTSRTQKIGLIDSKRKPWEHKLENYVSDINVLFSKYMSEMGCTGEIRLKKRDSGGDGDIAWQFKTWGIEILVSFRENAKAQILSAQRHSGGERSVSTIMYLMALQDMMVAPFRCVDEINQGLDDRNERLVFRRIVQNSTSAPNGTPTNHSGQYFLITPKLLPNLTDMEEDAVTILFVFNGPYSFRDPTEWDTEKIVKAGLKRLRKDQENELEDSEDALVPTNGRKKRSSVGSLQ